MIGITERGKEGEFDDPVLERLERIRMASQGFAEASGCAIGWDGERDGRFWGLCFCDTAIQLRGILILGFDIGIDC